MGMSETEEQHLAGQNRSIFKNKRLTQIEIQLLWNDWESSWDTPEDHTEYPIHHLLIEGMHEREKGDIPTLSSIDITLVYKHVNEVDKMLKVIPVRDLSELKYVARASALLVFEKVGM